MNEYARWTAIVAIAVAIGGPLTLGLFGAMRSRRSNTVGARDARPAADWRLTIASALLYALAFCIVFFIQELFLVIPKALTPGLKATLFHNNHHWDGDNPLARLFQGTGALATVITALAFAAWLKFAPPRSAVMRLFVLWMVFHGFFEALPQVVVGAVFAGNDVGMAMEYLQLSPATKTVAAVLALVAIVVIAIRLIRPLLELAPRDGDIDTAGKRTRFVFRTATLPALMALPLIILFRVPGTIDQVVIVPVAVTIIGISWMQAGAWGVTSAVAGRALPVRSIWGVLIAVALLLLVFQVVLRPGIHFY